MDSFNVHKKVSKFEADFIRAAQMRFEVCGNLNSFFEEHNYPFRINRLHSDLYVLPPHEKLRFNQIENRLESQDIEKRMGLDYVLRRIDWESTPIVVLIRFSVDPDFFIKLPSTNADDYLETLVARNTHVWWVARSTKAVISRYSRLVPLQELLGHTAHHVSTTPGNTNRLSFAFNPGLLIYRGLNEPDIFGNTLLHQIEQLL